MAIGQERPQSLRGLGNRIRRRNADDVEAFAPAVGDQCGLRSSGV
jgi:hypothetical protein